MTTPSPGDFSWYPRLESFQKDSLKNMYDAITKLGLWEWLKHYKINPNLGFQYDDTPELSSIFREIASDGHSSASFGWCMSNMWRIARLGWAEYYIYVDKK
jgi:hypothetical protein